MSKTEKIFYTDSYIKEIEADVKEIKEKNGKFFIALDKTIFFPGGGGQSFDTGYIDNQEVIETIEENECIYHVTNKKIENLKDVKCSLNWDRRFQGMQKHLAQHILSGSFFKLFNANTAGIHLGHDISYVDIIGDISKDKIEKAEIFANKIIEEKTKVEFIEVSRDKAKTMGLRRKLQTKDAIIRVVAIENLDINACCGIHPNDTLEVQLIKIVSFENHKGNTRIYYKAGKEAVEFVLKRDELFKETCNLLSCGQEDIIKTVENLKLNNKVLKEENSKIKMSLSSFEIKELIECGEQFKETKIISKVYENQDNKYLNKIANKITLESKKIVLFASKDENKVTILFAKSKDLENLDMGVMLKDCITLVDGKGGGSKLIAQGAGKNVSNIENTLEYAVRRVKESL